jgi:uncharacterized repeat protein (TIGR01451 family)
MLVGSVGQTLAQGTLTFSKAFGAGSVSLGGSTSLTLTLGNTRASVKNNVTFTDTLPAGLVVASPSNLTANVNCIGGSIAATPGGNTVSWTAGSLAPDPGMTTRCVISLTVTATSLGTKNNTVTATDDDEDTATATASLTVTTPSAPSGRVTIIVSALGRDGTFAFSSTLPGAASFSQTTSQGSATQQFQNIAAGTFTVTQASPPTGFKLASVQCDGVAQSGSTATIIMTGSNNVTCTFTNVFDVQGIQAATQAVIRNFLEHRAAAILGSEPDGTRGDGRLTGWLFGSPSSDGSPQGGGIRAPNPLLGRDDVNIVAQRMPLGAPEADGDRTAGSAPRATPFKLSGSSEDSAGAVMFATSLGQMRLASAAADVAKGKENETIMGLGRSPRTPLTAGIQSAFDVWIEGHVNYFADDRLGIKQNGHTHIVYIGADYRLHPAVLAGVLIQFDWSGESAGQIGTSADGRGWMVGPYVAVRLTQNLSFDGRAAWGASNNHVNPFGLYEDSFSTSRSIISGRLVGNWFSGPVRFTPSASLISFRETQDNYVDAINVLIPKQTVALDRVTLGQEVGYRFRLPEGGMLEPFVGFKGIWDFNKDDASIVGSFVVGNDPWHGKVEGGAIMQTPWGASLRGTVAYDGIGDRGLNIYQGRLLVTVPLN